MTDRTTAIPQPPGRRSVLRGVGAAGAAATVAGALAACSSEQVTATRNSAGAAASAAAGQASSAVADAIKQAEIPVGGGKVVGEVVITQPTAGEWRAFSAKCPHQGCLVNKVENRQIMCPCHQSVFDAATGARISGPAPSGLTAKQVTIGADGITVS